MACPLCYSLSILFLLFVLLGVDYQSPFGNHALHPPPPILVPPPPPPDWRAVIFSSIFAMAWLCLIFCAANCSSNLLVNATIDEFLVLNCWMHPLSLLAGLIAVDILPRYLLSLFPSSSLKLLAWPRSHILDSLLSRLSLMRTSCCPRQLSWSNPWLWWYSCQLGLSSPKLSSPYIQKFGLCTSAWCRSANYFSSRLISCYRRDALALSLDVFRSRWFGLLGSMACITSEEPRLLLIALNVYIDIILAHQVYLGVH